MKRNSTLWLALLSLSSLLAGYAIYRESGGLGFEEPRTSEVQKVSEAPESGAPDLERVSFRPALRNSSEAPERAGDVEGNKDAPRLSKAEIQRAIDQMDDLVRANAIRENQMIQSDLTAAQLAWQMHHNERTERALTILKSVSLKSGAFEELFRGEAFRRKQQGDPDSVSFPSGVMRDGQPVYLRVTLTAVDEAALGASRRGVSTLILAEMEARILKHNRLSIRERRRLVQQHLDAKAARRKMTFSSRSGSVLTKAQLVKRARYEELRGRAKITSPSERLSSPLASLRSLDESPDSINGARCPQGIALRQRAGDRRTLSTGALPARESSGPPSEGTKIARPKCQLILAQPLSRFGVVEYLPYYESEELVKILLARAETEGVELAKKAAQRMALCARGTPREVLRILDSVFNQLAARQGELARYGEQTRQAELTRATLRKVASVLERLGYSKEGTPPWSRGT